MPESVSTLMKRGGGTTSSKIVLDVCFFKEQVNKKIIIEYLQRKAKIRRSILVPGCIGIPHLKAFCHQLGNFLGLFFVVDKLPVKIRNKPIKDLGFHR